jgi:hypothetical protein
LGFLFAETILVGSKGEVNLFCGLGPEVLAYVIYVLLPRSIESASITPSFFDECLIVALRNTTKRDLGVTQK